VLGIETVNVAPDPELVSVKVWEAGSEPPRTWLKVNAVADAVTMVFAWTTIVIGMLNGARRPGGGAVMTSLWTGLIVIVPV